MGRSLSTPELNAGVSNIASAAGFTAGDYVYQQRTDTGTVPAGALATGAFAYNNIPSSTFSTAATKASDVTFAERDGGGTGGLCAAKLNNGNIVIVYAKSTVGTYLSSAYFKIVDAAGATVVAETSVAANVAGRYQVSVCVLPNNNFVVAWALQQSSVSWYPAFRIYQQDGTAVTAATSYTGQIFSGTTTNQCNLMIKPRSDNTFIIAAPTSNQVWFLQGSAAGFSGTFNGIGRYTITVWAASGRKVSDFAIRSDNTIHIFYTNGTNIVYDVLSSTGSATTTGAILDSVGGDFYSISCSLMPSNNVYVFWYGYRSGENSKIFGWSWNGTAASYLGALVSFSTTNTPNRSSILESYAQGGSGNFTLFYCHSDTGGAIAYQIFNSSGTLISNSVAVTVPSITYPLSGFTQFAIFDIGSETRVYTTNRVNNDYGANTSFWLGTSRGVLYFSYNSTSYALNKSSTANFTYGNVGALPLGAYAKSASTPIEAAFTISATGSYTATVPAGTNLVGKVTLDSVQAIGISTIQLQNGNIAFAWNTSSGVVKIAIYSPAGTLVNSITAATNGDGGYRGSFLAPFSNGSFVLVYGTVTSNQLSYKIYNSSLTELFSGNVSTTAVFTGVPAKVQVAAYGDRSQVAIAYRNSVSGYYEIKDLTSANVLTTITTGLSGNNAQHMQLIPYAGSAFGFIFDEDGAVSSDYSFLQAYKTGPTTFTILGYQDMSWTNSANPNFVWGSPVAAPSNNVFALTDNGTATSSSLVGVDPLLANSTNNYARVSGPSLMSNFASGYGHAVGYTGNGAGVWAVTRTSTNGYFVHYTNVRMQTDSSSYATGNVFNSGIATYNSTNYECIAVAPHVEGAAVIAFLDANSFPSFFVPVVQDCRINQTLTAGTDISTTKLSLTPESGYVLRGVALTTASAGGSGLVQTKGVASVSASYQSVTPTQNFDFRISTANGVRGSITGRTVTLEG